MPYQTRKLKFYTRHAVEYEQARELMVGAGVAQERNRWAAEVVQPGQRVLEIGCGVGDLLQVLSERVGEKGCVVGGDLCNAMLDMAKHRPMPKGDVVHLVNLDATSFLPFASKTFDCVCGFGILQEVATPRALIEEIHRVLKPGGAFRGIAITYKSLTDAAEVHMASSEEIAVFFRPQNTIATMFIQIFGPAAATRWEPLPNLTSPDIWRGFPDVPMEAIVRKVAAAGKDIEDVSLGALRMTARRLP